MPIEEATISSLPNDVVDHSVSLQPVFNQLYSLVLLFKEKDMPGLGEWVARTRESMTLEQLHRNRLVMNGLFYAFTTEAYLPSFGAYLDHLQSLSPLSYQDRLLAMYINASPDGCCTMEEIKPPSAEQKGEILSSVDNYLEFLCRHFGQSHIDLDLEAQAYRYAIDPPAMKALIIDHLREMWETHLTAEWTRIRPMLSKAVEAFHRSGVATMARRDAIRFVIGKDITDTHLAALIDAAEKIILAPSAHIGPYLGKFTTGKDLVILFGARLPDGAASDVPDLSRTEILTRLDALADDNRLRILRMAADAAEVRATEVITALDISQSAASRSLTQLTANGYLIERRRDGGKSYSLNPARIQDTLIATCRFLGLPAEVSPQTGK